jgi:hypothetical protein
MGSLSLFLVCDIMNIANKKGRSIHGQIGEGDSAIEENPQAKSEIALIMKRVDMAEQKGYANTEYASILTQSLMMLGMTGAISKEDFLVLNELGRECAFE